MYTYVYMCTAPDTQQHVCVVCSIQRLQVKQSWETLLLYVLVVVTCGCLVVVQKGNEGLKGGPLKNFLLYKSEERVWGLVPFPVALGASLDPARQGEREGVRRKE